MSHNYVGPDREGTEPFGDRLLINCYALKSTLTDLDGGLFAELENMVLRMNLALLLKKL